MGITERIVFGAIYARRSIRRFEDGRPVERAKIEKLLRAAMAAPTACNIQPWDFIVVTERAIIDGIKRTIRQYGDYNAQAAIVVCGNSARVPWGDHGELDCAMALENIMVAAPTLGIGTVCVGGFDRAGVKALFALPPTVEPIGLLYLGYPGERKRPRTKYLEEAVHWNGYDSSRDSGPRPGDIIAYGPEASV